ncbi:lysophospholipid acyltransferase family protein [Streptomyces cyaneofuscatus]|uniref:1-acyl-sn-glycerol-3-phosphate acyltransferase n=1 Tax=Streptomyces cyaneofuscatus TaxID=66883 RepID=A0ABZ1ENW8_9ACTN|nr:lysophospholipid acyltransferase family protein [Streptomyces cyaneofuscatus]WSB05799.1 1-acyl-sn-glycerol-3-phosphate acyltransferase [Streptomyces cyaneofuscatus]WSD50667.1 1-acyl-sn-glycerol-3-phosphate acyltransferase [Streptomyces cyaneofuscatus]
MLSNVAAAVIPCLGRLTVTSDHGSAPAPGSIIVANHTSLADPGVVLAALLRLDVEPVVLATAGLWRIPVLGRLLEGGGHVPVHRGTHRAADALDTAAAALRSGRHVLIYGEGRIPPRTDAAEAPPESFRSGLARLAHASGAPVVPLGQAGARRVTSGPVAKQIAGFLTAPARRPRLHVHLGAPLHLPPGVEAATATARAAVTTAWRTAARHLGSV